MIERARHLLGLALANKFIVLVDSLLVVGLVWLAFEALPSPAAVLFVLGTVVVRLLLWRRALEQPQQAPSRDLDTVMRRNESQRRQSIRDEASGLYQRWYLELRLDEEAARCRRFRHDMSVVTVRAGLIDLSDWSYDLWRTKSADVARSTASVVRNVDLCASLGPLEFALCLVHCDREGAEIAAERIVAELKDYTCAIGVAVYPDDEVEAGALIELARGRATVRPFSPPQAA